MPYDIGPSLAELISYISGGYGVRPDGSEKGQGWLGPLQMSDGQVMTEQTAESDFNGRRYMYPLITPNQGFRNLSELSQGIPPSNDTHNKAWEHALNMMRSGRSPYKYEPFNR